MGHKILFFILIAILGYLIGSIPNALIIGKVFFKKDIRDYGSHNLGGTNAARILSLPVGILIMILDALKCIICMFVVYKIYNEATLFSGLFVCIGHCFPLFAGFKGGKSVACNLGLAIAISLFITNDYIYCLLIPFIIFLLVLFFTRYMSLASMSGSLSLSIISFITNKNIYISIVFSVVTIIVILRHKSNIINLINHKESKVFSRKKKAI